MLKSLFCRLNYFSNYYILLFLITSLSSFSQTEIDAQKQAETFFLNKNYADALDVYKKLFEQEPDNIEYNLHLALCYLNTFGDRSRAISHLEYLFSKKNSDSEILFSLGLAYQYANRFNDAIGAFENAK